MGSLKKAKKVWPPKTTTGRLKTKKSMQLNLEGSLGSPSCCLAFKKLLFSLPR
jgi:hypothetical protein